MNWYFMRNNSIVSFTSKATCHEYGSVRKISEGHINSCIVRNNHWWILRNLLNWWNVKPVLNSFKSLHLQAQSTSFRGRSYVTSNTRKSSFWIDWHLKRIILYVAATSNRHWYVAFHGHSNCVHTNTRSTNPSKQSIFRLLMPI